MPGLFSQGGFISRLRKFKDKKIYSQSLTHAPLLSRKDIFELYYRIQNRFNRCDNQYEVAHRTLGDNRSIYKGYGLDYEESRPYQAGDEPRFMNWRVTARTGELYMKVFREERRPGVFVLVDRRASMRFGTRTRIKAAQAARSATLLSFMAQRENAQISGVILDEEASWVRSRNDASAAFNLVNQASKACPPIMNESEEPSLSYLLKVMTRVLTKGSTVYLISDFHDLTDTSRAALLQLSLEHNILALHIIDPAEIHLPQAGQLSLTATAGQSNEIEDELKIDSEDNIKRKAFNRISAHIINSKEELFLAVGISYKRILSNAENIDELI